MFGAKIGLHVIKFPSKKFGYVGSVPACCCSRLQADRSAVLGGRAIREGDEMVEYRPMIFDTEKEAIDYANACGYEAKTPVKV